MNKKLLSLCLLMMASVYSYGADFQKGLAAEQGLSPSQVLANFENNLTENPEAWRAPQRSCFVPPWSPSA